MRRGHRWRGLVLAGSLLAGSNGQAASPSTQVQNFGGLWDLSTEATNSKCRIAMHVEQSPAGRQQITIPLSCLKVFPILAPVDAWALTADGHLDLLNSVGETVLEFGAATDIKTFVASGPHGEVYRLIAMQGAPKKGEQIASQGGGGPTPAVMATKQADAAGRYSVLRDGGKDTGCMLTLDNRAKAAGSSKASLAPGCRDQGIVIFDPVGWQIVNGRLVLTARKGHKTHLDVQQDGTWKKDPKEGSGLILKKL